MFGRATIRLGIGPHSSFLNILVIISTPYRSIAAYCYIPSSVVCLSICLSVTLVTPAKTD